MEQSRLSSGVMTNSAIESKNRPKKTSPLNQPVRIESHGRPMSSPEENRTPPQNIRRFATTRWSMVLAAGRSDTPDARRALATLCEAYWYPLYAYVRRRGQAAEEARDLTQEFFADLLGRDALQAADPKRGKFRSFLLGSLNNFLAKEWRREGAQKRGGHSIVLSLDFESAEARYSREPSHEWTPERIFLRRWAMEVLEQALSKLQKEYAGRGKLELFERFRGLIVMDKQSVPYRRIAQELDMTEGAVKVAVHRLRNELGEA
jgi:RNA polymerase sigma factor (sigma-70 family)